jgi:hypothetical protein
MPTHDDGIGRPFGLANVLQGVALIASTQRLTEPLTVMMVGQSTLVAAAERQASVCALRSDSRITFCAIAHPTLAEHQVSTNCSHCVEAVDGAFPLDWFPLDGLLLLLQARKRRAAAVARMILAMVPR